MQVKSPTTRFRIAALVCAAILLPALCSAALTWDTRRIDLTAKPGDKQAVGLFHFANSGKTTVTIVYIQPSCGCTTAQLEKRVYAPGETGEINAVFTIGDRVGEQEKSILVSTDEAPDKTVSLELHVMIPELLTYSPRLLMWNMGDKLEDKPAAITTNTKLQITAIIIVPPLPTGVSTRIEPVQTGVSYRLLVRPLSTATVMNTPVAGVATFADGTTQPFKIYALVR
jgi:hypothetical protein